MTRQISYAQAGVHIDAADRFVGSVKGLARTTRVPGVVGAIGSFGALFDLSRTKFRNPILVSSTDGVGTKLKLGLLTGRLEGLGVDLVGMNVNDILTTGAQPLFFLDYLAIGKVKQAPMTAILRGIVDGCRQSGMALVGGETAEMPGVYAGDDFDIAGFCVGAVEKSQVIDPARIRAGDAVVGLESSGFHSNGFSLVRRIFSESFIRKNAAAILAPTRIYVRPILKLLKKLRVNGMAHVTGGGFYDKVGRVIPRGLGVTIDSKSWPKPQVFKWVESTNKVSFKERYRTFNMGIGYTVMVPQSKAESVIRFLKTQRIRSWVIGQVTDCPGVNVL